MKKTLVALAVTAFATSASAVVFESDNTKVEFDGSIRVLVGNAGSKTKDAKGVVTEKEHNHSNLKNDGSRLNIRAKHAINDDVFGFSRVEFRFNNEATTTDGFGDIYAHRAYAGIGSKTFGALSFGRQETIADDVSLVGFDKSLGVTNNPLTTHGKSTIRYDYTAIDGLKVGFDYRFAEDRGTVNKTALDDAVVKAQYALEKNTDATKTAELQKALEDAEAKRYAATDPDTNEVTKGTIKSGYGVGAVYEFNVAEGQSAKVAVGYTRDNYATGAKTKHYKDAVLTSGTYTINDLTLGLNYGFSNDKNGLKRTAKHYINTGVKYSVTKTIDVYGNYAYTRGVSKESGKVSGKEKVHGFMLGSSYQIHKNVLTFVEGKIVETKKYNANNVKTSSKRDNAVGVGLRVFW